MTTAFTTNSDHNTHTIVVAYAAQQAGSFFYKKINCLCGTTAFDAIMQSGVLVDYAEELTRDNLIVGVFSNKLADPKQHILQAGDRVELYRPLLLDPKDIRRKRAVSHPVGRVKPRLNQKRVRHTPV